MNRQVRWRAVLLPLVCAAVAACGDGGSASGDVAVRDSSGIRIVEHGPLPSGTPEWSVEPAPHQTIGSDAERGFVLYQVTSVARMADGRIVAAGPGTGGLLMFGADGRPERRIGREGGGPGEFQALFWVGTLPGDTLAAWDAAAGRLTLFDGAGAVARTITPARPLGTFAQPQGMLADGRLVLAASTAGARMPPEGISVSSDSVELVALGRDGRVESLGSHPGGEMLTSWSPAAGSMLTRPLPFGHQPAFAAHGARVYALRADAYEIAAMEPGAGVRMLLRASRAALPVSPADVQEYRRSLVTLGAEGDLRRTRQEEEMLERAPYPETMAPVTGLLLDTEGNLWVQEAAPPRPAEPAHWSVYSPDGRLLAAVRVPPGLTVRQVGPDWVLGTTLDADGVESAALHRLRRE